MADFKTIEVPTGRFIGWGKLDQQVTVRVVSFDPTGGTDFKNNICPQLIGTLVADCDTYKDKGATKERLEAGEMVTVNGGLANLKKGLLIADPKPGDLVRMTFVDTYKTAEGDGKVIKVEHARDEPAAVSADDL
jgi:hypothetical protein